MFKGIYEKGCPVKPLIRTVQGHLRKVNYERSQGHTDKLIARAGTSSTSAYDMSVTYSKTQFEYTLYIKLFYILSSYIL